MAAPGEEFDGYRLVRLLGRGGMGEVWLAQDDTLDRSVAVKFVHAAGLDTRGRLRFMVEARAAARVVHPNVVTVHRVGEHRGQPYLVSELVHGTPLDKVPRPVPWQRALELGVGLARGLAAAHRKNVLHRDLKPANAILADDGTVKLLDFGLAKLADGGGPTPLQAQVLPAPNPNPDDDTVPPDLPLETQPLPGRASASSGSDVTAAGAVMGTPLYMPPESWRGEPATRRSDVYSLGALLYTLVAGAPPFAGSMPDELSARVTTGEAPALGADVDAAFAAVIARCLRRDPEARYASGEELRGALERLAPGSRPLAAPTGNPYRGLRAFEAEHRDLFFGRAAEIDAVLARLRSEGLVLITGDSGVGKSSLVRAGVVPAIVDGALGDGRAWSVLTLVPGRAPLEGLRAALAPSLGADGVGRLDQEDFAGAARLVRQQGRGLLVVVDQLEELVTLASRADADRAAELIAALGAGTPGVRVLCTTRGDFLTRLARLPALAELIGPALYLLAPLGRDGLRQAVVEPARAAGVTFETSALVDRLVEDTADAEGGLPLLQFALAELWDRRDVASRVIPEAALDATGGVAGTLARHADRALDAMLPDARTAARRVLVRLVTTDGTRARRTEAELGTDDASTRAALDALARARLVIARAANVELAHEALLSGWPRLREWLAEDDGRRAVRERLGRAAQEWHRLARSREALWRDRQLAEAEVLVDADLTALDREFLAASRSATRRRRWLAAASIAGVVAVALAAWLATQASQRAALDRRVGEQLVEARALVASAAKLGASLDAARARAFAAFDRDDYAAGEEEWARVRSLTAALDAGQAGASRALETALLLDHTRAEPRALLADVLYARAVRAEEVHESRRADELVERLLLYDDDRSRRTRWLSPGKLLLTTDPPGVQVTVMRYVQGDRKIVRAPMVGPLDPPVEGFELPAGSYTAVFEHEGRTTRWPFRLGRGERLAAQVRLAPASIPPGFAYVPPGRFLWGSREEDRLRSGWQNAPPLHAVQGQGFFISTHETTWGEWLVYLDALPATERARRTPGTATLGKQGGVELARRGDRWELRLQPGSRAYVALQGQPLPYARGAVDWSRLPVTGVSWHDAAAYAAWLHETGRVPGARLCGDREWEQAARGADGRLYPHGDELAPGHANWSATYGGDPAAFGPDPVGTHGDSNSPYGATDLAGNAFEWTDTRVGEGSEPARGGSYAFDQNAARTELRELGEPTLRDATVGLRICAALPAVR